MKIAITGSNGFIGKHLKEMLINMNYQIVTISNKKNFENKIENYTFDEFFLGNLRISFDCILHLASPNYDYCKDGSLKKGITELTQKLVSSLHIYNCKKLIYFSSAKVYGEPSFNNNIYYENSKLMPKTDYGKEKAITEEIIRTYSQKSGLNYVIYRMPMVYGPNMESNIGRLIKMIESSIPIPYFSETSRYKKSFLSIENIKKCIAFNIKNPDSINNDVYNLTDNNYYSLNEFTHKYKKISGSRSFFFQFPKTIFLILSKIPVVKNFLIKLYGSFALNNDKINSLMNIRFHNLEEGLFFIINKK